MKEYTFFIVAEHCTNYSSSKTTSSRIISTTSKNKRLSIVTREVREEFSRSLRIAKYECVCITSLNLIGIEEVDECAVKYNSEYV